MGLGLQDQQVRLARFGPRSGALVAAVGTLLVMLLLAMIAGNSIEDYLLRTERDYVAGMVGRYQDSLKRAIHQRTGMLQTLKTLVEEDLRRETPNHFITEHFDIFASGLNIVSPKMNFMIAPGGVITFVYPPREPSTR